MIPALEWASFAAQNGTANDLLVQACGMVLLAGGGLLFFRAFRERYLLAWAMGWAAYVVFRLAEAEAQAPGSLWAPVGEASFGAAVALFAGAALLYSNRQRRLLPLAIAAVVGISLAVAHAVWWPEARGLAVVLYLLWTALSCLGAAELALFSLGRRSMGPWLFAAVLLLLPTENPSFTSLFHGSALTIVGLMATSMLLVMLEDAADRNRRLAVINEITTAVAEARDFEPMMNIALEQLRQLMHEDAAWFRILDGDQLILSSQCGLKPSYLQARGVLSAKDSLTGRVIASGRPVLLRSSQADDVTHQRLEEQGFGHVLIVPIQGKTASIGALALGGRGTRSYTPSELQFAANTCRQLGIAVENLRLVDQVMYSHRQWVNTFDSIRDLLLVHDEGGRVVRVNRALSERLGSEFSALIGRALGDVLPGVVQGRCPYCDRSAYAADATLAESPDPCFGGYSIVSTHSYSEGGSQLGTIHIIRDTTDQRLAEHRYKLLFDGVEEGVFMSTPQGKLLDCNAAFVRMLGYESREEVLGFTDLALAIYADPGDREHFRHEMDTQGMVRNYQVKLRRKNGELITALESSFASRDAAGNVERYQGFLLDVTEQQRAEEELQRRNRELRVLLAVASIATQSLDLDQILELTLREAAGVFQADSASVYLLSAERDTLERRAELGHSASDTPLEAVPAAFLEEVKQRRMEVITAEHLPLLPPELRALVERERLRSWLWVVLWSKEQPCGILTMSYRNQREFSAAERDLLVAIGRQLATTIENVRLYQETRRAYDNLSRTQEQLLQSEKMSAVGQLISGVAHELNNPLTAILGYSQLLENEPLNERGHDFAQKIFRQAQRTHRVVQSLLDFARQHKPKKEPVDLRRVVEDTLMLRDYDLRLNNVVLQREYAEQVPAVVADAHQLEQVFLNIINNAADSILEQSRAGTLRVRVFQDAGQACVEFHDSGPGLKEVKRIFDPFFTTKKVGKGTGLGLSICYGIVKEHGGDIVASNHAGGGAVFTVRLPIAVETVTTAPPPAPPAEARRSLLNARVLVVDDEEPVLEFEREVLTHAGAEVVTRNRGEEALAAMAQERFDAVILDGKMPGGWTGFDIYRWVTENRPELAPGVILTLSNIDDAELRELLEERRVAYLVKPFETAELIAALRRVLEQKRAAAATPVS